MQELIEQIREMERSGEIRDGAGTNGLRLVYLRRARNEMVVSQKDLAEVLDLHPDTIRRYENGLRGPVGIDNAEKIARYLGMKLKDITSREALEEYASQSKRYPRIVLGKPAEIRDLETRIHALEDRIYPSNKKPGISKAAEEAAPEETRKKGFLRRIFT